MPTRSPTAIGSRALLIALSAGATCASPCFAQHVYTGGAGDNLWCTPGNWNPASVPSGAAMIPGSISQRVRMAGNCTPNFQSLTAIGPVRFDGEVRYAGQVIAADIEIQSGAFTIGPTTPGGAALSLTDAAVWRSGILANQMVTVEAAGAFQIIPGGGHTLNNARLTNEGSVAQSAAITIIGFESFINNNLWTLTNAGSLLRRSTINDTGVFNNTGTLCTDFTVPGPAALLLPLVNSGTVHASVGDLDLVQSSHFGELFGGAAQLVANAGRRMTLGGPTLISGAAQATGDGTVTATSGAVSLSGQLITAMDPSGAFGGGFVLNTAQGLQFAPESRLRNAGTLTWQSGPITGSSSLSVPISNEGRFVVRASSATLTRSSISNLGRLVIDLNGTQLNLLASSLRSNANATIEWRGGSVVRHPSSDALDVSVIQLDGTLTKVTPFQGRIAVPLDAGNDSRVEVQEGELVLDTAPLGNVHEFDRSIVSVSSGAVLRLTGPAQMVGGEVTGQGVFRVASGGSMRVSTPPLVASMSVSSDGLHVQSGRIVGAGVLQNNGTLVLSGSTLGEAGQGIPLEIRNNGFLHSRNSSQLVLLAFIQNFATMAVDASILIAPGSLVVNHAEFSIGGAVTISAQAGTPAGALINEPTGLMTKRGLDQANISATFSNQGNLTVQQGRLQVIGPIVELVTNSQGDRELTAGTWIVQPGATLSFGSRLFRVVSGSANLRIDGTFDDFEPTRFRDQSVTELGTLLDPNEDMILSQDAMIVLDLGGSIGPPANGSCPFGNCTQLLLTDECTLAGSGVVDRVCTASDFATISPGLSPGTLVFRGLNLGPNTTLAVEIAGPTPGTQHDRVNVTNAAALGGTLRLFLLDGFAPAPGSAFTIIAAGTLGGAFHRVEPPPDLDADLRVRLDQSGTELVVRFSLAADFDGNGIVNPDDLSDFITAFFTVPPATNADYDGNGIVNPDDLSDYITEYFS